MAKAKRLSMKKYNDYIASPQHCPHCDMYDLNTGLPETDDNRMWQSVSCRDCGSTWTDIYTLTDIINFEKGRS